MRNLLLVCLVTIPLASQAAEQRIEERRSVAADAQIEVGNVRGRIEIQGWDRDEVEVTGTLGDGVKGLIIEGDQRRLEVRVDYPNKNGGGGWFGWWGSESAGDSVLIVKLPHRASLEVESVSADVQVEGVGGSRMQIESVSGAVSMSGEPATLEVGTVSGSQQIESSAREVRMETVSGRVSLRGTAPDRLRAESVSGDIVLQLESIAGSVNAESVSGDLNVGTAALAGRIQLESMSGSVEVSLPRGSSARLHASSFSGSIESDAGEVERRRYGPGASLEHVLGKGDADVSVETFSGRIRIHLD